jgi:predicted nucleic acid-binding protein
MGLVMTGRSRSARERRSTKQKRKREELLVTLSPLVILPYTESVARRAGEIARDATRPLQFADAAIAATAIMHKANIATFNRKDFYHIPGITLKDTKT